MTEHPELNNPNILSLYKKLKELDNVSLVKFHPVVNPKALETYGQNLYRFSVVVEKHQDDPNWPKSQFREMWQYVPYDLWNNPDNPVRETNTQVPSTGHDTVVSRFKNTIKFYLDNPTSNLNQITTWVDNPNAPIQNTENP